MTCPSCEKHLLRIAHLKSELDKKSYQVDMHKELYDKERAISKYFEDDRERIRNELIECREKKDLK